MISRSTLLLVLIPALPASAQSAARPTEKEHPFVVISGEPAAGTKTPERPRELTTSPGKLQADGLTWLKRAQHPSGRWLRSPRRLRPDPTDDVISTSLAVLAYLGAGHTQRYGAYKLTVSKALRWLKGRQTESGRWGAEGGKTPLITHALACQALAEAYFITKDPFLKRYVRQGYAALLGLESERGGFGFKRGAPPNALATTLAVLALKAVKLSGFDPSDTGVFERASARLKGCTDARGLVGFRAPGNGISLRPVARHYGKRIPQPRVPLFTAGAVIARIFCKERRSTDGIRRGFKLLTRPRPDRREPLYDYLATYSAFQFGGEPWKAWARSLRRTLDATRDADGSWPIAGVIGRLGGRSGATALRLMTHELVLRYERAQADD